MPTSLSSRRSRRAASGLTYGLLVGLVSILALSAIAASGSSVNRLFGTVATNIAGVAPARAPQPTPPIFATFDPATVGYSVPGDGTVVFSNGNLTTERRGDADTNDSWAAWYSDRAFPTSGKGYFEVAIETFPSFTAEAGPNRLEIGIHITPNPRQIILSCEQGYYWQASNNLTDPNHYCGSGTVGVAVDIDAGRVWFTRNGSAWNIGGNPATGALGTDPAVFSFAGGSKVYAKVNSMANGTGTPIGPRVRLNAGQEAFAYTPPAGFTARLTEP